MTPENEREALGFWSNLDQLQWLGFGLPAGLMAFNRDQTLGLRSVIPLLPALVLQSQGEKLLLAAHLEYRAFRFRASLFGFSLCFLPYIRLRLPESISHPPSVQASAC